LSTGLPHPFRGVNIGSWLVLEKWMTPDVFSGTNTTDQFTFDSIENGKAKLQHHWETFFTENDMAQIATWGLNAVRIPIGYWAYDNTGTRYISGADAYLEQAIGWARKHGIKVLVDCHGSPGSQNGFDNSGQAGSINWQSGDNLQRSIDILVTMAKKYGSVDYADVVFALEIVNEPASWAPNDFSVTQQWAQQAYSAVKGASTNPNLIVVMHDSFEGPALWQTIGAAINGPNTTYTDSHFALDVHLYQNMMPDDSKLTQPQHINKACSDWSTTEFLSPDSHLPVFVGEFSAATNICVNPDNSTIGGSECTIDGCQCLSNVPMEDWSAGAKVWTRKFFEAQMLTFERHGAGWFLWSYKVPDGGAWS
ncbi:glycoside hydrolase family 5 protein, partial [Baudoinia panamericana UAMH 10762]